jgi:hypothetical protein
MSLFDPETGKVLDPEGLRSIQFNGQGMRIPATMVDRSRDVKYVEAVHQETGDTAGYHAVHGSGRVDAVAAPPTVRPVADVTS